MPAAAAKSAHFAVAEAQAKYFFFAPSNLRSGSRSSISAAYSLKSVK